MTERYLCQGLLCSVTFNERPLADHMEECARLASELEASPPGWPGSHYLNSYGDFHLCIGEVGEMGITAQAAAPAIYDLLDSSDARVRAHSLEALGLIGAAQYVATIRTHIESQWPMEVEAAAFALGALAPDEFAQTLYALSAEHWSHQVRETAQEAARSAFYEGQAGWGSALDVPVAEEYGIRAFRIEKTFAYPTELVCNSEQFGFRDTLTSYRGQSVEDTPPIELDHVTLTIIPTGYEGEWVLSASVGDGDYRPLLNDPLALYRFDDRTAMAVLGPGHLGLVRSLYRLEVIEGEIIRHHVGEFPDDPYWSSEIRPGLWAARSPAGFHVFDRTGLVGEGNCVPGPVPEQQPR